MVPAEEQPTGSGRRRSRVWIAGLACLAGVLVLVLAAVALVFAFSPPDAGPLQAIPDGLAAGASAPPDDLGAQAGAVEPGGTDYPIPDGALYVDAEARTAGVGTEHAPFRTIQGAVDAASDDDTIVIRGGEYHESVVVADTDGLTLQAYPHEAVWLDGSAVVDGWVQDGSRWRHDDWSVVLDASPTYERGAPDNVEERWAFIDDRFPMAAHPDQVWIGDERLEQVARQSEVGPGRFAVDHESRSLVIGSDPTGREVRASVLPRAMQLQGDDVTVRGIGVRRYATSVPDMGAVTLERDGALLEQVVVRDGATGGIFVGAADATLRSVTAEGNGMIGVAANFADDLLIDRLASRDNNTEHFNRAPVAGGMKLTRSRGVTVTSSVFADNLGTGLWFDQSCLGIRVTASRLDRNTGHGLFLELSGRAVVDGNVITQNDRYGVKVNDTSEVVLRDNVLNANASGIAVLQDERRPDAPDARGLDRRMPQPDPDLPWVVSDVVVVGNTLAGGGSDELLTVEDYTGVTDADSLRTIVDANLYVRDDEQAPETLARWQVAPGRIATFAALAELQEETGRETHGIEVTAGRTIGGSPAASEEFSWPGWALRMWPDLPQ
ncbi:right-handed parallel beta-helix repeat-containing protein [Agromyces sp. NPDC058110]|uniref:right-handed parallel beta-helix repeat-containing protein n=1 Tax=Agromyces sp. NPDC058110 TaxID=3346345 RepID=UPI0036DCC6E0